MKRTNIEMDKIIEEGVSKLRRDLLTYPIENSKNKCKRLLKNMLGRGEAAPDRFFWPHAMMAEALWEYYKSSGDESIVKLLEAYYDCHQVTAKDIKYPDTVMNGYTLIDLYEKTGKQQYKKILDSMAEYIKSAPRAKDGSILYRKNQKEMVYADTIGMIVPFMCRYGAITGDKELQELAVLQVMNFIKSGIDQEFGLSYHAYDAGTAVKHGIIGWGRAVGWILMGIADSIAYVDDALSAQLQEVVVRLLSNVVKYQRKDGFFSWQLQAVDGPIDISATGMILLSMVKLLKHNYIDDSFQNVADKCVEAVVECGGAFEKCLAECQALSCYPQVYAIYPWGTALVIEALVFIA